MQFSFTNEQEDFRGILRRFFTARSPTTEVRKLMATDTGFDREGWKKLNQELGLTAVHIPEAYGGQGFGCIELGIVLEEMGRALLCAPFFSSVVLAATAILNAGTEAQKRKLLPAIAAGDTIATLAFTEDNGLWDASGVTMTAVGGNRLNGAKSFVVDGHTADLIVVLARQAGHDRRQRPVVFTVRGDAPGLKRTLLKTMDETRKLARLEFKDVEAKLLGEAGKAAAPFAKTMHAGRHLPCQRDGRRRRQAARGPARLREDAHAVRPADRLVPVDEAQAGRHAGRGRDGEIGRLLRRRRVRRMRRGSARPPPRSPKPRASDTYLQTAIHAIQMHGGIGFTWDKTRISGSSGPKARRFCSATPTYHRELMMQHWAD